MASLTVRQLDDKLKKLLRLRAEVAATLGAPAAEIAALLDEAVAVAEAQGEPPLAERARDARHRLTR